MMHIKNILVPTDLSEHSVSAMDYAESLGLLFSARIHLLHVTDIRSMILGITDGQTATELWNRAEEGARVALENFSRKHVNQEVQPALVVRAGVADEEIIRYAQQEGVDIIVMATHGRTGLQHVLLGSVAERVVRRSPVPVLTVKPDALQSPEIETGEVETDLHIR